MTSEQEIWESVITETDDYTGLYEISNYGRVKSLNPDKIKRQSLRYDGYYCVRLTKDGKSRTIKTHILVSNAFNGLKPPNTEIDHKDGDSSNIIKRYGSIITKDINKGEYFALKEGIRIIRRENINLDNKLIFLTSDSVTALRRLVVPDDLNIRKNYIKAHTKKNDERTLHHNWCDEKSRKMMKKHRDKINNGSISVAFPKSVQKRRKELVCI